MPGRRRREPVVVETDPQPTHHDVFHKFQPWAGEVPGGFWVNFLGVLTSTDFLVTGHPPPLKSRYRQCDYPPFQETPPDLDPTEGFCEWVEAPEEYFEWIDLLGAVTRAESHFTMIELGAGWGRWITNAAAALRQYKSLPYTLIAVEAEPTHFQWMKRHLLHNNVDLSRCQLIEAAVADREGRVGFYTGQTSWGGPADWYGQCIGGPTEVKAITLQSILQPVSSVDLLDADVQGAELAVFEAAVGELDKVKRVHVGTHSSEIELGLRSLFGRLGWQSVHDFSCLSESETPWGKIKFTDGVQSWVNPRFWGPETLAEMTEKRIR